MSYPVRPIRVLFTLALFLLVACSTPPSAADLDDGTVEAVVDSGSIRGGTSGDEQRQEPSATPAPTDIPAPTATEVPTDTPAPTETPEPTDTVEPTTAPAANVPEGQRATVVDIIDGDTIDVSIEGEVYRVRYIGMDTPERGAPFFAEATGANRELVEGQQVILVKDVSETDRFGRLLRYVYLVEGAFVNAELLRRGYAQVSTFPPDVRHVELFTQLQSEARNAGVGLWSVTVVPAATNTVAAVTLAPQPTATFVPATATLVPPTATLPPAPSATLPPPPTATLAPPTATQPPPPTDTPQPQPTANCSPAYPTVCIPPPPPDLDCGDIGARNFTVLPPDPHRFDGDGDGVGCES